MLLGASSPAVSVRVCDARLPLYNQPRNPDWPSLTSMSPQYSTVAENVYDLPREKESVAGMDHQLKDVLLKNQRMFSRESPYLDALLVYVSSRQTVPSSISDPCLQCQSAGWSLLRRPCCLSYRDTQRSSRRPPGQDPARTAEERGDFQGDVDIKVGERVVVCEPQFIPGVCPICHPRKGYGPSSTRSGGD